MPRISRLAPSLNLQGDTGKSVHRACWWARPGRMGRGVGSGQRSLSWPLSHQVQAEPSA